MLGSLVATFSVVQFKKIGLLTASYLVLSDSIHNNLCPGVIYKSWFTQEFLKDIPERNFSSTILGNHRSQVYGSGTHGQDRARAIRNKYFQCGIVLTITNSGSEAPGVAPK